MTTRAGPGSSGPETVGTKQLNKKAPGVTGGFLYEIITVRRIRKVRGRPLNRC